MYPIFSVEYSKEKKYLEKCASNACKEKGEYFEPTYTLYPIDGDNVIELMHWGNLEKTNIIKIWLNECDEVQVSSKEVGNDEVDYDMFSEFSNDEMKQILDIFGIKY